MRRVVCVAAVAGAAGHAGAAGLTGRARLSAPLWAARLHHTTERLTSLCHKTWQLIGLHLWSRNPICEILALFFLVSGGSGSTPWGCFVHCGAGRSPVNQSGINLAVWLVLTAKHSVFYSSWRFKVATLYPDELKATSHLFLNNFSFLFESFYIPARLQTQHIKSLFYHYFWFI